MADNVWLTVRDLLADYVGVPAEDFQMEKSLDLDYAMDSTELTEFARQIESRFALSIAKSQRSSWERGEDVAAFVRAQAVA